MPEHVIICWLDPDGEIREIKRVVTMDLPFAAFAWRKLSDMVDEIAPENVRSNA